MLPLPQTFWGYWYGGRTMQQHVKRKSLCTGTTGFLYAFSLYDGQIKIGKTVNLTQRFRPYRTLHPDGRIVYTVRCENMDRSERILHDLLKLNDYHVKREIFSVPENILKEYMNMVSLLCNKLVNGKDVDRLGKIAKFLERM